MRGHRSLPLSTDIYTLPVDSEHGELVCVCVCVCVCHFMLDNSTLQTIILKTKRESLGTRLHVCVIVCTCGADVCTTCTCICDLLSGQRPFLPV